MEMRVTEGEMSVSVVGFADLVWATGMPSDRDREHMVWHKIEKKREQNSRWFRQHAASHLIWAAKTIRSQ
jgi:hypothetical protein